VSSFYGHHTENVTTNVKGFAAGSLVLKLFKGTRQKTVNAM